MTAKPEYLEPVASSYLPTSSAHARLARLDLVKASFDDALQAAGGFALEADFAIAGRRARLRATDVTLLRRLSRTLSHLALDDDGVPELTIHLWDSSTLGTAAPPIPEADGEEAPGAFFYYSDERLRVGFQLGTSGDPREVAVYPHEPTPALSVLDSDRGEAWYWVADAERVPYWEEATPLRFIFDWWLRDRDIHQVHAGGIGTAEAGVLIVGRSGSGKSTAALSALESELRYAGDDYVAVQLDPDPWVHSLYNSGKLVVDHVVRLPFLLSALANPDELDHQKAVVYVQEHWPERTTVGFPLKAILVSRVVPGAVEARIVESSPLTGLSALAPSTVFQMHTRGRDSLARMRRLVEIVPTYVLELGSNVASIPRAVSQLLEELSATR